MIFLDQWKALSGRIRGLMRAAELHAHYLSVRSRDTYGRAKQLRDQAASIITALKLYRDQVPEKAHDLVNVQGTRLRQHTITSTGARRAIPEMMVLER